MTLDIHLEKYEVRHKASGSVDQVSTIYITRPNNAFFYGSVLYYKPYKVEAHAPNSAHVMQFDLKDFIGDTSEEAMEECKEWITTKFGEIESIEPIEIEDDEDFDLA